MYDPTRAVQQSTEVCFRTLYLYEENFTEMRELSATGESGLIPINCEMRRMQRARQAGPPSRPAKQAHHPISRH